MCMQDTTVSQPAPQNSARESPAAPLQPPQTQAREAPEPSQVPRKVGVTDGAWDDKDAEAMREAQDNKQPSKAAGASFNKLLVPTLPSWDSETQPLRRGKLRVAQVGSCKMSWERLVRFASDDGKAAISRARKDTHMLAAGALKVLLGKSQEELGQLCVDLGFPKYRGKQLYEGILNGARSPKDIQNVSSWMRRGQS